MSLSGEIRLLEPGGQGADHGLSTKTHDVVLAVHDPRDVSPEDPPTPLTCAGTRACGYGVAAGKKAILSQPDDEIS